MVTAACWFAGNLDVAALRVSPFGLSMPAALAAVLVASHRAPLAGVLLGYPTGRLTTSIDRASMAVVSGGVLLAGVLPWEAAAIASAAVLAAAGFVGYRRAVGPMRRPRALAFRMSALIAASLVASAGLRVVVPAGGGTAGLLLYEITLAGVAAVLASSLVRRSSVDPAVADFVVELGEVGSGALGPVLAEVLGDPSLQVGFSVGSDGGYVDARGAPFVVPDASPTRAITPIGREGRVIAVLVHDPAVLDGPDSLAAVETATQLAARNAALQAELRQRLTELRASRRRLVGAAHDERQRLADRLDRGAAVRLRALDDALRDASSGADPARESTERIARARVQVDRIGQELLELSHGLDPVDLRDGGLAAAMRDLTAGGGLTVDLDVPDERFAPEIESAAYYVCVEGLANVGKHANATRAGITVTPGSSALHIELRDDGVGGADLARGTGLRGLTDRVEALGGSLAVDSPPGGGTRLVVELPFRRED